MFLTFLGTYRDGGLLILRIGLGIMFLYHGAPKLFGGPEKWAKLGTAMGSLGIHAMPEFWGFMASAAEFFGAICLIMGFFFREACIFLFVTMAVAAAMHLERGDGLRGASHAIEVGIVFLGLILIGPGRYSVDRR